MSMVRVNDNIKEDIMPILNDLGLSLSEAINIFLHQVKMYNGLPFDLRRKGITELNDDNGSYICESGYLHDYSRKNIKEIEKDRTGKTYKNVDELMKDLEEE